MPSAPTSSLRTAPASVLRYYPAAALEVAPDGVITDSNGCLEREGCASVVGRALSEILEPASRDDWRRLLESGAQDASVIALAFRRSDGGGSRAFLVARGSGAQDRLRLFEQRCRLGEAERLAQAQAEAALRQHDEVLAIVAHDLRNPLNRISLTASVLRESLGAGADPRPWELMQRGVKDMDRLIQDLLDVSRMEAGALKVDRLELPIAPLLTGLHDQFAELARSRGVELVCRTDRATPHALADRTRLLQALSNLIDNALRLTPSGGTVTLEALPGPGYVEFAVRDTGPGIPTDQLPHLFDRFWQGARARRGGAGLGLAIVKGIVEAHGGRVFAESSPGKGATFRFWIPVPAPAITAGGPPSPAVSQSPGPHELTQGRRHE